MDVVFIPSQCKGKDATFKGSVTLRMPSFDERYQYLEEINLKVNSDGEADLGSMNQIGMIRKMVRFSKDHYSKVELKRVEDGKEFKSFDEMAFDPSCDAILSEVAGQLINGLKMGNG